MEINKIRFGIETSFVDNNEPNAIYIIFTEKFKTAGNGQPNLWKVSGGRNVTHVELFLRTARICVDKPYSGGDPITISFSQHWLEDRLKLKYISGQNVDDFSDRPVINIVKPKS